MGKLRFILIVALIAFFLSVPLYAMNDLLNQDGTEITTDEVEIPQNPSLTLAEAIGQSLENNRNIELAEQMIEFTRNSEIFSMGQLYPMLSLMSSYTRYADSETIEIPEVGDFEISSQNSCRASLNFSYPLYAGGQRRANRNANEADVQISESQRDVAVAMIAYAATDAFCSAREGFGGLAVRQASLDHLTELERHAQAMYDAGYMPLSDLLMVQVAKSRAEVQVLEWKNNVQTRQSALNLVLGQDVSKRWTLVPIDYPVIEIPFRLEMLTEWAMENRPELREIQAQRDKIQAQIDLVHAGMGPKVDIVGEVSHSGDSFGISSDTASMSAGINVWWVIYDFGLIDGFIEPYEDQLAMLDVRETELRERIRTEVERALLSVNTQYENVRVTSQAVIQAEEALRVSQRRMEEGLGLMVEVLDTQATWTELGAGSVFATHMYYRLLAALSGAVGVNPLDMVALIEASGDTEQ